ncbi:MAG: DUF1223 domain-containing protein [Candidatus Tectimicrobiota bacterium]
MQSSLFTGLLFWCSLASLGAFPLADRGLAQPLSARSGPQTVALLELYTSEGCNSCPPADEWVNALAKKGFGLDRVVPLGFHVDYWDNLGWPDRFAQSIFTQRQRDIAARHRSKTIYTPQLVLQGQSLTQWDTFGAELQRINHTRARATLALTVTPQPAQELAIVAQADLPEMADRQQAQMYMAVYENRLISDVKAGENKGRTLRHNYVVRQWLGPLDIQTTGPTRLERTFTLPQEWKAANLGVVVFVQHSQNGAVLQALALPLDQ